MSGYVRTDGMPLSLPYNFSYGSALIYNNKIHILGGGSSLENRKSHYSWDGTEWKSESILPMGHYDGSAVVYDGKIHIFSDYSNSDLYKHYSWDGTNWTLESTLPNDIFYKSTVVYNNKIYSFVTNSCYSWDGTSWTTENNSIPIKVNDASRAIVYNNKIYVLAMTDYSAGTYCNKCYTYDGTNWEYVNTSSYNYAYCSPILYNNILYILGGQTTLKSMRYFINENWYNVSPLPYNFRHGEAVVYNNIIYILGGDINDTNPDGSDVRKNFFFRDNSNGEWYSQIVNFKKMKKGWIEAENRTKYLKINKFKAYTLPYNFKWGAAVVYNNKIHILGGGQVSGVGTNHYSETDSSDWVESSTLPYDFFYGAAVIYDNKLHIMGSANGDDSRNHYSWDGEIWTQETNLPYDNFYCWNQAVIYNNEIHILGGEGNTRKNHYSWNGTNWSSKSTLPYNLSQGSVVVYDNKIHILGGFGKDDNEYNYYKHYSWNGVSWKRESTIPCEGFAAGAAVVYNNKIYIFNDKNNETMWYSWDGTSWAELDDISIMRYSLNPIVVYNNRIHILGSSYDSENGYHYMYGEETNDEWVTEFETKTQINPEKITPFDNVIFDTYKKRILNGWVGNSLHEPKLALESERIIEPTGTLQEVSWNSVNYGDDGHSITSFPENYPYDLGYYIHINSYIDPNTGDTITNGNIYLKFDDDYMYIKIPVGDNFSHSIGPEFPLNISKFYIDGEESLVSKGLPSGLRDTDGRYRIASVLIPYEKTKKELQWDLVDIRVLNSDGSDSSRPEQGYYISVDYYMDPDTDEYVYPDGSSNKIYLKFNNSDTYIDIPLDHSWHFVGDSRPYKSNSKFYKEEPQNAGIIHLLGGKNCIHYSLDIEYENIGAYSGRPKKFNYYDETPLPYDFNIDMAVFYEGEIHIFGSLQEAYQHKHYAYNGDSWRQIIDMPDPYHYEQNNMPVSSKDIMFIGEYNGNETIYLINNTSVYKYMDESGFTRVANSSLPFSVDNDTYRGSQSAIYDKFNKRIILINSSNNTTSFYYSYDEGVTWLSGSRTHSNSSFLHPIIVDKDVIPSAGDRYIFVIGGASTYDWNQYQNCFITESDGWYDTITPYPFLNGCAVIYNHKVHIFGSEFYDEDEQAQIYSTYHYSWNGYSWDEEADLPYGFYNGSAVVYHGTLYLLGGFQTSNGQLMIYSWNGTTWTQLSANLPYSFNNGAAVVYKNKIHILGGIGYSTYHYSWDGPGNSWIQESTLPYYFTGNTAVVYDNKIHILGSGDGSAVRKHYSWDGTSWISESYLPYGFSFGVATVYDNKIHIMGSDLSDDNLHYSWDGTEWQSEASLPCGMSKGAIAVSEPISYIVGITNRGSYDDDFSNTGLAAFKLTDTKFEHPISIGAYISENEQEWWEPDILASNGNKLLLMDTSSMKYQYIYSLDCYYSDMWHMNFNNWSCDILERLAVSNLDNLIPYVNNTPGAIRYDQPLYIYGGKYERGRHTDAELKTYPSLPRYYVKTNTLYIKSFNPKYKRWNYKKLKLSVDDFDHVDAFNFDDDFNISVMTDDAKWPSNHNLYIFMNDSSYSDTYYYYMIVLPVNHSSFKPYAVNTPTVYNYRIGKTACYGAVSYNNTIYVLGGYKTYKGSIPTTSRKLFKVNLDGSYGGECHYEPARRHLYYTENGEETEKYSTYGYAICNDMLHFIYKKDNNTVEHEAYNFKTDRKVTGFVNPPSGFTGIVKSSGGTLYIVCEDTYTSSHEYDEETQFTTLKEYPCYKVYYLNLDGEWEEISKPLLIDDLKNAEFLTSIKMDKTVGYDVSVTNIELITAGGTIETNYGGGANNYKFYSSIAQYEEELDYCFK